MKLQSLPNRLALQLSLLAFLPLTIMSFSDPVNNWPVKTVISAPKNTAANNATLKASTLKPASIGFYQWSTDSWIYDHIENYQYNVTGQITQIESEAQRIIYQYEANGNVEKTSYQMKDGANWLTTDEYIFQYDSHGNLILSTVYTLIDTDLLLVSGKRAIYAYKGDEIIYELHEEYVDGLSIWIAKSGQKTDYEYNTNNQTTRKAHFIWSEAEAKWILKSDYHATFNGLGAMTTEEFNGKCRYEYFYDSEQVLNLGFYYIYNSQSQSYEYYGRMVNFVWQNWIPGDVQNAVYSQMTIQKYINSNLVKDDDNAYLDDLKYVLTNQDGVKTQTTYQWNVDLLDWSVARTYTETTQDQALIIEELKYDIETDQKQGVEKSILTTNNDSYSLEIFAWDNLDGKWIGDTLITHVQTDALNMEHTLQKFLNNDGSLSYVTLQHHRTSSNATSFYSITDEYDYDGFQTGGIEETKNFDTNGNITFWKQATYWVDDEWQTVFDYTYEYVYTEARIDKKTTYIKNGTDYEKMEQQIYGYGAPTKFEEDEHSIAIYPAITSGNVTIEATCNINLKLYNLKGVLAGNYFITDSQTIDISHLHNGIYIYQIINNGRSVSTGRIVKK
jgi:hypothetical protein